MHITINMGTIICGNSSHFSLPNGIRTFIFVLNAWSIRESFCMSCNWIRLLVIASQTIIKCESKVDKNNKTLTVDDNDETSK